jgi:hypothetical protein
MEVMKLIKGIQVDKEKGKWQVVSGKWGKAGIDELQELKG